MVSVYYDFIDELREKLKNKHINFNAIINLINSQEYEDIHVLIAKIVAERENIWKKI